MVEIHAPQYSTKAELVSAARFGRPDYPASVYGLMAAYLRSIRYSYENADEDTLRDVAKDWLHELVYNNPNWPANDKLHDLLDAWIHALKYGSNRLQGYKKTKDDHLEHLMKWLQARPSSKAFTREEPVSTKPVYDPSAPLDGSITPASAERQLAILARVYGMREGRINLKLKTIPGMPDYVRKLEQRVAGVA